MIKNRVRILIAKNDIQINDVINATGLSRNTISRMINCRTTNISTKNIDKLCQYFRVTPNKFFAYDPDNPDLYSAMGDLQKPKGTLDENGY